MAQHRTEVRDGMRVDWDVPITMEDGVILRADVFRPVAEGRYPVVMNHGPYAKGIAFQEGYAPFWKPLVAEYPEILEGSTNAYQNWETVDPERWVPDGYAVIRVDSRGSGRSPGFMDIFSPREISDYAACIEWAGTQSWSNGKVGLLGVSYYAVSQWLVAAQQPPHLAAIIPWEGATDYYREFTHHAGLLNQFVSTWYPGQVRVAQHGVGDRGPRNPNTGETMAGPETLTDEELAANRRDSPADLLAHPLNDAFYVERSADLPKIEVPLLSATNWAHGLHTRGGFEGWAQASSEQKWLEVHGLGHVTEFYTAHGRELQKRFFGHFLKGQDTGWDRQVPVELNVRHVDGSFELRAEQEWPLARTEWTKFYLHTGDGSLSTEAPADRSAADFEALGEGLTFTAEPFTQQTEITGPLAARIVAASSTTDADLFLTLRVLDPEGRDLRFVSALDPAGVVAHGWLRASHRAVDPEMTLPHRPWHPHDSLDPLTPGEAVPLDIEIWPTSVVVPAGYRLAVTVQGRDFEFPGDGPWPESYGVPMKGHAIFLHADPHDRPADVFGGVTTLVSGGDEPSYLLLPVIPRTPEHPEGVRRGPFPEHA
jgi:predicted acyl esterase